MCVPSLPTNIFAQKETIEPNQNIDEVKKFLAKEAEVRKKLDEKTKEEMEEEAREKDTEAIIEDAGKVDMKTKMKRLEVSMSPFKFVLYPIQQKLEIACQYVCITKSFLMWEESYYCYWIVIISMTGGLVVLFVPWYVTVWNDTISTEYYFIFIIILYY